MSGTACEKSGHPSTFDLPLTLYLGHSSPPSLLVQEKFKTGLLHSAEDFKKTVSNLSEDFETNGPFTSAVPVPEALEFISQMRQQLEQLKTQEGRIRKGLHIFKIEQPPSHIIQQLEKVCMKSRQLHVHVHACITPIGMCIL